jgi:DNA-binding GntR family transcriptional regulator
MWMCEERMPKEKNSESDAYRLIKRALIMKRLLPGQPLTEEWLSEHLHMSRTPVRSALKLLEKDGLVKIIPYRGAFVVNPTTKDIHDLFHVRTVLECHAARLAAPLVTDASILELQNLVKKEREAYEAQDFETIIELNTKIHAFPATLVDNSVLLEQISTLIVRANCYMILKDPFYNKPPSDLKVFSEHNEIVNAFKRRDPDAASEAVRAHLETNMLFYSQSEPPTLFDP